MCWQSRKWKERIFSLSLTTMPKFCLRERTEERSFCNSCNPLGQSKWLFSVLSSPCFPFLEAWLKLFRLFWAFSLSSTKFFCGVLLFTSYCSCQGLWAVFHQCWSLFSSKGLLKCLYFDSTGKAPPNLPQGVPPLLHNQYIVGPGGLLPAYPVSNLIVPVLDCLTLGANGPSRPAAVYAKKFLLVRCIWNSSSKCWRIYKIHSVWVYCW